MELMKLIQRSNQGDRTQRATYQFASPPAQCPPQHPCEEKSSNEEVAKMGHFVSLWERWKINVLARER
jgi:hypothetical protein